MKGLQDAGLGFRGEGPLEPRHVLRRWWQLFLAEVFLSLYFLWRIFLFCAGRRRLRSKARRPLSCRSWAWRGFSEQRSEASGQVLRE